MEIRPDEIGRSKGDALRGTIITTIYPRTRFDLCFGASKTGEHVALVGGSNQSGLPQVVLRFEVLDFGAVRSIDEANRDGEYGVSLGRI